MVGNVRGGSSSGFGINRKYSIFVIIISITGRRQRRIFFGSHPEWYNCIKEQNDCGKLLLAQDNQNLFQRALFYVKSYR